MPPKKKEAFDTRVAAEANPAANQPPQDPPDDDAPAQKPPGSPELIPWHAVSRAGKADFLEVIDYVNTVGDGIAENFRTFAYVERAITAVAQIPAAAKAWFPRVTERELMDLYRWYSETQMGEAKASPAS